MKLLDKSLAFANTHAGHLIIVGTFTLAAAVLFSAYMPAILVGGGIVAGVMVIVHEASSRQWYVF
jgi:hypothetical protein